MGADLNPAPTGIVIGIGVGRNDMQPEGALANAPLHATPRQGLNPAPGGRQQECKSGHIGQNSRREQEGAPDQNRESVQQGARGNPTGIDLVLDAEEGAHPLPPSQGSPCSPGNNHQTDRGRHPNPAAHLEEGDQLDERNGNEEKEESGNQGGASLRVRSVRESGWANNL